MLDPSQIFRCSLFSLCLLAGCGDDDGVLRLDDVAHPIRFEVKPGEGPADPRGAAATADPDLSVIFAGHLRGGGTEVAPEFVAALPRLAAEARTLVLLGDLTAQTSTPRLAQAFRRDVLERFPGEVLIAPGNHDVLDRSVLRELVGGRTYRSERAGGGSIALVVLDTELDLAGITGEQLAFFRETVSELRADDRVAFVFFCFHKFVWFPGRRYFRDFYENGLNWTGPDLQKTYPTTNFWTDLFPPMRSLVAAGKTVLVLGGDLGFRVKSMFAEHEGVLFLGTGMGAEGSGNTYLHFAVVNGVLVCTERAF